MHLSCSPRIIKHIRNRFVLDIVLWTSPASSSASGISSCFRSIECKWHFELFSAELSDYACCLRFSKRVYNVSVWKHSFESRR